MLPGEAPEDAARRECEEETGCAATSLPAITCARRAGWTGRHM
ncbi:NUDIX domain-containing protein [Streptomyces klenkii]